MVSFATPYSLARATHIPRSYSARRRLMSRTWSSVSTAFGLRTPRRCVSSRTISVLFSATVPNSRWAGLQHLPLHLCRTTRPAGISPCVSSQATRWAYAFWWSCFTGVQANTPYSVALCCPNHSQHSSSPLRFTLFQNRASIPFVCGSFCASVLRPRRGVDIGRLEVVPVGHDPDL